MIQVPDSKYSSVSELVERIRELKAKAARVKSESQRLQLMRKVREAEAHLEEKRWLDSDAPNGA